MFDPVDGVTPKAKRILQDVKRAISSMKTIHEHQGAFVPGLASGRVARGGTEPGGVPKMFSDFGSEGLI